MHADPKRVPFPGVAFDAAAARGLTQRGVLLVTDIRAQRLHVCTAAGLWRSFAISTAVRGLGNRSGSGATPPGWHRVAARIGADAPLGQVFVARRPTGQVLPPRAWRACGGDDLIVTRILRLEGLEPRVNRGPGIDSFARFIYIHGTNHEQHLGRPASHGCIRMANRDIATLFAFVARRPAWCWIGSGTGRCSRQPVPR